MPRPGRARAGSGYTAPALIPATLTVSFDRLPSELQAWLRDAIARGSDHVALTEALVGAGYEPGYAQRAAASACVALPPAPLTQGLQDAANAGVLGAPNRVTIDGHVVELRLTLAAPRVVVFGNLLSAAECDELIALARGRLRPSSVVNVATGEYDLHPHRTSSGMHFARGENDLIRRIESRIAQLLEFPVSHGEPMQILHYPPGAQYRPHHDYFDPAHPGNDKVLAMGGQRIATLVMYLNDCAAGGATVFPQLGLEVLPQRGAAVYFTYVAASGALEPRLLHGGAPVAAGEKWIATKWLREREYDGPGA